MLKNSVRIGDVVKTRAAFGGTAETFTVTNTGTHHGYDEKYAGGDKNGWGVWEKDLVLIKPAIGTLVKVNPSNFYMLGESQGEIGEVVSHGNYTNTFQVKWPNQGSGLSYVIENVVVVGFKHLTAADLFKPGAKVQVSGDQDEWIGVTAGTVGTILEEKPTNGDEFQVKWDNGLSLSYSRKHLKVVKPAPVPEPLAPWELALLEWKEPEPEPKHEYTVDPIETLVKVRDDIKARLRDAQVEAHPVLQAQLTGVKRALLALRSTYHIVND